ncbi:MAG: hypothetical protein QNJ54_27260 [Prochloraceae cyanobacterium]|nr:hypothetical protein [Prochloraceae cyanobacterium]
MNNQPTIPDPFTRERLVNQLRESNRQLELSNLALEEAIANVETDLRQQRKVRLLFSKN